MEGLGIRQAAAALIAVGALLLAATTLVVHPAAAAITTPFTTRFDVNTNGSVLLRGNTVLTCPITPACTAARNGSGAGSALNNNNYTMIYTDADGDPIGTFNDSNAMITMPPGSSVLFAGLYWGANSILPNRNQVRFRTPAGPAWTSVTASSLYANSTFYQGFADVTALVAGAGNGVYGVANVQAALGGGQYAGWSLAIAYRNPAEDMRSLRIFDGFGAIQSGTLDIPITGFETPHSGTVHAKIGAVAYEGDLGNVGDSLEVDGRPLTDAVNPANNFFNSTVSESAAHVTGRDPDYQNTLGFDVDQVDATGMFTNGQLSTNLTLTTSGDTYYPGVITFSIDLYAPKITTNVTGTDVDGGDLLPGDTIEYRIAVRNDGSDTADNVLLSDAVPPHTTYVPGSASAAGSLAAGVVSWNLGSIPYLGTAYVTFRVTVDVSTPAGYAITNLVNVSYSGRTTSVAVAGLAGSVATPVLQPHVDRAATLTVTPAFVQRAALPRNVAYTATVTNATGDLEPAARAVLTLPTGITPDTLPTGCAAALPVVTCAVGPLVAGSSASVVIPVVVDGTAATRPVASLRADGDGSDAAGGNDTDTAALAVNSPPVAVADSATTSNNAPVSVPVLANDTDPDDLPATLTASIAGGPAHGAAVVAADQTITYTPVPGWAGADQFDYQVADPHGGTATGTVTVTTANAAPTANDDMINTRPNTPVGLDVLVNDADPNGDTLTVTGVTAPPAAEGTVTFTGTRVTFTPTSTFAGTSRFGYTIADGHGGTAGATISIDVANADPTAADDVLAAPAAASGVPLLVLANDTDPNGDSLTITTAGPQPGVTVAADHLSLLYTAPAGLAGTVTFPYSIDDGHGGTDTATVTLTVANARPHAYDFTVTTPYGTAAVMNAAFFSTDPNSDTLRVSGNTAPAHGTVSLDAYGKLSYQPDVAFSGTDSFSYTIDDGNGGTDTGHVTIDVANGVAVARPDVVTAVDGTPLAIPVLANDDPDPNGDPLTVRVTTTPAHPVGADGRITYTSAGLGTDTFEYELDDGKGGTSRATVTITTVNTAPIARADSAATDTDTDVTVAVLANDEDPNGQPVTLDAVGTGGHGTVTDNHDGTVTYTPATGFYGTDAFLYSIRDPAGLTDSAIVTVTVRNAAPVAVDDTFRVRADVPTRLDLLANDRDPNTRQHLSVASVGTVAKGTVVLAADGTVTYRATAGGIGPDGFTYVLTDDLGRTDTADVRITIDGRPTAVDDNATTAGATGVDVRVLANDTDPEAQPLAVVSAGPAGSGNTRVNADGTVRYTPITGFSGVDSFGYTIRDPIGNTDAAQVRVQVANAAPIARPDVAAGLADRPLYIDVLANDEDPNPGQSLVVEAVANPANGTAEVVSGRVRFLPARGWSGQETFAYRIGDGHGGTAGSTVTVTISNGAPVAVADQAATPYHKPVTLPVLDNDLDPGGDLTVRSVTQPGQGTATFTANSVTYTPPEGFGGPATFGYTAADDAGHTTSAPITVTVGAAPAVPDRSATAEPGGKVDVPLPHEDKGGRTVTVVSVGKPAHGTAVLNADGTVTYTPAPGFNGVDTFTYEVVDADGNVATASIIVTVTAPAAMNKPPVAGDDSVTVAAGDPVTVRPALNDSDPDGDRITIVKLGKPAHGSVRAGAGDTVTYQSAPGFAGGEDSFDYTIADGRGGLATARVTVSVRALETLPVTGGDVLVLARVGLIAIAVGSVIYWMALPPKPRKL